MILILVILALYVLYAYGTARQDTRRWRDEMKWHIWKTLGQFGFGGATALVVYLGWPARGWFIAFIAWWLSQRLFEGFYSLLKTGKWYGEQTRTIPVEWMPEDWREMFTELTGLQIKWDQIRLEGNQAKYADAARIIIGGIILYFLV